MWNLENMRVKGLYLGEFPVTGTVTESRVGYGGKVLHYVNIDQPIKMPWRTVDSESVILHEGQIEELVE